jgi:hypothetical protein
VGCVVGNYRLYFRDLTRVVFGGGAEDVRAAYTAAPISQPPRPQAPPPAPPSTAPLLLGFPLYRVCHMFEDDIATYVSLNSYIKVSFGYDVPILVDYTYAKNEPSEHVGSEEMGIGANSVK